MRKEISTFYYITVGVFLLFSSALKAQSIEQTEVVLDKEEKKIIIFYRLDNVGQVQESLFEVELYYTQDGGNTYIGPLTEVEGHVGEYILEGERFIVWNYFRENPSFDGKNVQFKLKANYKPLILGGPENFIRSLILPGFGNPKVRFSSWKNRWMLTTVSTFGLIGTSLYLKNESRKNYDSYLNATSSSDAQNQFDLASRQNLLATSFAFTAATVWLTDIARVIIRGFKNRKLKRFIDEKNQLIPPTTNKEILTRLYLDYDLQYRSTNLKLVFSL